VETVDRDNQFSGSLRNGQRCCHAHEYAWDAFQEGLREHANGHIDIGLETVAEMRKSLLEVPPATTCEALKAQMQIYVDGAKAKFDLAHADYDKETKHGKRQGAVLRKQIE